MNFDKKKARFNFAATKTGRAIDQSQTPGGVLNFELGTDVRPEVSTTTL